MPSQPRLLVCRRMRITFWSLARSRLRFLLGCTNGGISEEPYVVSLFDSGVNICYSHLDLGEDDKINKYRDISSKFYFNYAMLVVNSFGLQNALDRSPVDIGHFFARCHSSAVACATILRDEMGAQGYLRYAPDSNCVQASYAVLSLLKVRHPVCSMRYRIEG